MNSPRVWVISELYYPEDTSTGYLLTRLAEGIAARRPVGVLTAQPTYAARGVRAPRRETRNGVIIERCRSTSFSKDSMVLRAVNLVTITLSIFFEAVRRFRPGDAAIVVTNPPLLPYAVALACRLRGCRSLLLIHDVYPEVLYTTGLLSPRSLPAKIAERVTRWLYRSMDHVIALGRDMADLVAAKMKDPQRIAIIPNWADCEDIRPAPREGNPFLRQLGLDAHFVVQYSGNMGRTHGLEDLTAAARLLAGSRAHFLFIGWGAKRRWLDQQAATLDNVSVVDSQPRSELQTTLNACDVAVISFVAGMSGLSVPSRMYNIMAAGKPIVAVSDASSELARVVTEEAIGWVVPPGDSAALAGAIRDAMTDRERLAAMGRRARAAAESKYAFQRIVDAYEAVLAK